MQKDSEYILGLEQLVQSLAKSYEETTNIIREEDIDLYCKIPLYQGTPFIIKLSQASKLDIGNDQGHESLKHMVAKHSNPESLVCGGEGSINAYLLFRSLNALRTIRQWDMLDACHDGPGMKVMLDEVIDMLEGKNAPPPKTE